MIRRIALCVVAATCLLVVACGESEPDAAGDSSGQVELAADTASFDLAANSPGRFLLGLFNADGGGLVDGSINLQFEFVGQGEGVATPERITATYLAAAGSDERTPDDAVHQAGVDDGVGVYEADEVTFSAPGSWLVTATFRFEGQQHIVDDAFEVLPAHQVPMVGDPAPASANHLLGDAIVPRMAIDSRASDTTSIPDPGLHDGRFADYITSGKPTLLVVSTPTFCVSQFCGPLTETVQEMQGEYGERANFAHFEVWADYENREVNEAAGDWMLGDDGDGSEPWVFLIGRDGKVAARWDNVTNRTQMSAALDAALAS